MKVKRGSGKEGDGEGTGVGTGVEKREEEDGREQRKVILTSFFASASTVSFSILIISFSVSSLVCISSGCNFWSSCCITDT